MITVNRNILSRAVKLLMTANDYGYPRDTQKLDTIRLEVHDKTLKLIDWRPTSRMQVWVQAEDLAPDGVAEYSRVEIRYLCMAQRRRTVQLAYNAEELPPPPDTGTFIATMSASSLRLAIGQTAPAAQAKPSELGLHNVSFDWGLAGVSLTAGDHYRMSTAGVAGSLAAGAGREWCTVPSVDLRRLAKLLDGMQDGATVTVWQRGEDLVFVAHEEGDICRIEYVMQIQPKKYPDFEPLFDLRHAPNLTVVVRTSVLVEALETVAEGRNANDYLTLSVSSGSFLPTAGVLMVARAHGMGDVTTAQCAAEVSGDPMSVQVNASYLRHAVAGLDPRITPNVTIHVHNDAIRYNGRMVRVEAGDCRHVIMPKG
jgi:hypothetical protein